ncbi:sensor histidine kinase [Staphylococcus felis]|uniref:sensor histidine kinase n=1 Tax=Staphylococcus felis TaxID=46127 RepID=UPI0039673C1E
MTNLMWILAFLRERKLWLILLFVVTFMTLGFGWLDDDLSLNSVLYVCLVQWIIIAIFLISIFLKETRFLKKLDEKIEIEALKHHAFAETPFEKKVVTYLDFKLSVQKQTLMEQQEWLNLNQHSLTEFIHNIKTPVTALKLLIEKEKDNVRRQQLMYEWSRIDYMLDQQLYLSRINQKSRDLYFEKTALKPLVIEEVSKTRHISMNKGIGFEIDIPEDVTIDTDKRWFRMVIRQFISNAIKYSKNDIITIQSMCQNEHVTLYIEDRGCGIPKHDLPRIFQHGFTTTREKYEATASGMGLYLVDQVRDELGLQIDVQSQVNVGTIVTITFSKPNDMIARMSK